MEIRREERSSISKPKDVLLADRDLFCVLYWPNSARVRKIDSSHSGWQYYKRKVLDRASAIQVLHVQPVVHQRVGADRHDVCDLKHRPIRCQEEELIPPDERLL